MRAAKEHHSVVIANAGGHFRRSRHGGLYVATRPHADVARLPTALRIGEIFETILKGGPTDD